MFKRVIYYYQTFTTLSSILIKNPNVTHIHLSAIHFGIDVDGNPYIHLNDNPPNDYIFDDVWKELKKAHDLGITIILMIGGAGGAFNSLFSDFYTYYSLLKEVIIRNKIIKGVDLDIEEFVDIKNVENLIKQIKEDFSDNFIISMAPIQSAMQNDNPGIGGFIYKELYKSNYGPCIDYFNVQCYYEFSENTYDDIVKNGYPPNKIVMGMLMNQNFNECSEVIKNLSKKYEYFGGTFIWEYFDAPPGGEKDPGEWSIKMRSAMSDKCSCFCNNIYLHKIKDAILKIVKCSCDK